MAVPPAVAGIGARYLGWKPVDDARAVPAADLALRDLLDKSLRWPGRLKKHWLEFSHGQLRITEYTAASPYQYPAIPSADISGVMLDPADLLVFGLILVGYNEESACSVHVHAWRGESAPEVASFAARLTDRALRPAQSQDKCLHQHELRATSRQPAAAPAPPSLGSLAHSLAQELHQRLDSSDAAPLLHPPRDYDTLHRSHGNVRLRGSEQQLATSSRAPNGAYIRRQFVISSASENTSDSGADPNEPPPDYDTDSEAGGRGNARNSASSSSLSQGDDTRWSDPRLGFSTWRRQSDLE